MLFSVILFYLCAGPLRRSYMNNGTFLSFHGHIFSSTVSFGSQTLLMRLLRRICTYPFFPRKQENGWVTMMHGACLYQNWSFICLLLKNVLHPSLLWYLLDRRKSSPSYEPHSVITEVHLSSIFMSPDVRTSWLLFSHGVKKYSSQKFLPKNPSGGLMKRRMKHFLHWYRRVHVWVIKIHVIEF